MPIIPLSLTLLFTFSAQAASLTDQIPEGPLSLTQLKAMAERVDDALRRTGLVPADAPIASVHVEHLPYAYPVPSLGRDGALRVIQPWLDERHVLSRGRFGAWRYELGNMDHAVKMGVDAARRIVDGTPEQAWRS